MTNAIPVDLMKMIYGKTLAIDQRSLRTSKFRSMGLKKTHFNGAEYTECQYLKKFRSASSALPQIRISWDSSLTPARQSRTRSAKAAQPA